MSHQTPAPVHDGTPASLLLELRGMRRDEDPRSELWAGIAARIGHEVGRPSRAEGTRVRSWPAASLAAAATLALALGIGWRAAHLPDPPAETAGATPLLVRQADALDREYDGALREALATRPARAAAGADLGLLDRSAAEIRAAMERDPDAVFLLDQLQRVRARRLELTLDLPRLP